VLHKVAAAAVSLLAGVGLLTAPAAARALTDGAPTTAPRPLVGPPVAGSARCGAEPRDAAGWTALFGGLSGGWAGGDGAASLRLPDGRVLWLFGDTFTGSVTSAGRRGSDARIVRNSVVVTDGRCATVAAPGRDALPGRDGTWLWPTQAVVVSAGAAGSDTVLRVFAQRVRRTGGGAFAFARTGTAVVTLTVPWDGVPRTGTVVDLPAGDVLWGAALVPDGATTWVYGTREVHEDLVFGRDLMLARAPTATVADPRTWTYRTATGWSRDPADARPVRAGRDGVSTVPSVSKIGGSYVVVTKAQEFLDPVVVELRSATPWGPWTARPLLTAASGATVMRYSPALVVGETAGRAVVVVSRTSTSSAELLGDAELARPTFADVTLG
jgi:hypothetical protein